MNLPGLITVQPEQKDLINRLANMMGESFLEELWTCELLSVLGGEEARARKLEVSSAIMQADFTFGAPFQCCYALGDEAACAGAYLKSDLGGRTWASLEDAAWEQVAAIVLTPEEAALASAQSSRMEPISDFSWEEEAAAGSDFIHFYVLGVDARKRGSGAFRRLMEPFFAYADERGIPCFLETYSTQLEELYEHFGFETIKVLSSPELSIAERCMVRRPR